MRRHWYTEGLRGLEGRLFRPWLDYSLSNPIKESSMEQLAQLFRINIKMYWELRPPWASVPITSTSISSAMASMIEKTHSAYVNN
jgi:hypothetical protein